MNSRRYALASGCTEQVKNKYLQGVKTPFLQLINRFYTGFVEKVRNRLIWKDIFLLTGIIEKIHFCTLLNIAFSCATSVHFEHELDRVFGGYRFLSKGFGPIMNVFHFVTTVYK